MDWLLVATAGVWLLALWSALGVLRGPGVLRRARRLADMAFCAVLGLVLAGLLVITRAFLAFSGETFVAQIATRRVSPLEFELTYTPASNSPARQVRLRGDQWTVSGGIVKWHPWLTALGWTSYHKPMRLSGQFSRLEEQRRQTPSVEPLYEPGVDRVWETFYWADPALPFVEAVYGSSAYAYVEPDAVQEIYVTPSGYLIKRKLTGR
jgi:hypothetical protein